MDILLIEDNEVIVKGLEYSFSKNGYNLINKSNIKDTICYLEKNKPDIIILDISLPDGNGFDFFERSLKNREIPTLFLTAYDNEEDIVRGLNLGAEDYVTKPFSTKELLARINRIVLRMKKNLVMQVKDIKFDLDKMIVYKNNEIIDLSSLELKILHLLFININKVMV